MARWPARDRSYARCGSRHAKCKSTHQVRARVPRAAARARCGSVRQVRERVSCERACHVRDRACQVREQAGRLLYGWNTACAGLASERR